MNSISDQTNNSAYSELSEKVQALEKRIGQLESNSKHVYQSTEKDAEPVDDGLDFKLYGKGNSQLESHFGEYGLAWLGNIVLFFGITFFVQYLQVIDFKFISSILGFATITGIFVLSHYLKDTSPHMAKIFKLNAYLLVFYVTLKLHFFTKNPIISNEVLGIVLLMIVTTIILYISLRKKYALLTGLSIILIATTAILSDTTHVMLPLAALISIIGITLLYRLAWIRLVFLSIFMTYTIILFWMINNPFMGHPIQIISTHQFGYLYIYSIAGIFSLIALMPIKDEAYSALGIIGAIFLNGLFFIFLISLFVFSFYKSNYILPSGLIAFYCIIYSIVLKVRSDWKITSALYALFGFVALSVCIYAYYDFPRAFFFLAFQSLLVVSMAIWFRSKFIVIMNSFLYVIILMIYLSAYDSANGMNISFVIVALATARILNWKKERLTIQTDLIRNFYLLIAFFMGLFTLYHLIPDQYITLSWTVTALVYFVLSIILKNAKYRYMALGTMIAAAILLFIVDLARIELIYRVIAMLFLAVISIGLSFYYAKKLKNKTD